MEGFGNIDRMDVKTMEQDRLIDTLHKKFEDQKKIYQPNPKDFIGVEGFDEQTIEEEIKLTQSLKEKWDQQNNQYEQKQKRLSDVFEGIIVDQFCGEWMANKAQAFYTAEPDDYIRKVDCVVEFQPNENNETKEYLGLGIDVTFSSDYSTVQTKLDTIWNKEVMKGKEVAVKYIDTEDFKGSLDVCRVVIAADKETVYELARLYKNKDREAIDNHPFLANIISQIKCQLESYYRYAQKKALAADYLRHVTKTLSTFYGIYSEKEAFIAEHEAEVAQSSVYKTIEEYCRERLEKIQA